MPCSSRSARNRTIGSGMAASASIRSARSGASGSSARCASSPRDPGEHAGAVCGDQRLVEPAEPHAAGQVADDREAQLGGADQPVQHLATGQVERLRRRRLGRATAAAGSTTSARRPRPLLGQEDPEDRLLELGRAVEVGDAVVREHRGQPVAELLGQPVPLDVEALQVGVEVLARAVHPELGVQLLAAGPVAAQLGQVGEHLEQVELAAEHVVPAGAGLRAGGEVVGQGGRLGRPGRRRSRAAGAQVVEAAGGALVGGLPSAAGSGQVEVRAGLVGGLGAVAGLGDRLQPQQRRAGLDLAAGRDQQLAHPRRRTARAAPSPSSCSPAPAPARRPRPRRRPRPGSPRPARARASAARRPRRG